MTAPTTMPSDELPDEVERALTKALGTAAHRGYLWEFCPDYQALRAAIAAYASARSAPRYGSPEWRAAHHAEALTWLERHIPDGIRLVALALAETHDAPASARSAPRVDLKVRCVVRDGVTCIEFDHDALRRASLADIMHDVTSVPASSRSGEAADIPFTEERRAMVNAGALSGGEVPLPDKTTPEALAQHVESMVCSFWDWPGNRGISNAELVYRVALGALRRMRELAPPAPAAEVLRKAGEGMYRVLRQRPATQEQQAALAMWDAALLRPAPPPGDAGQGGDDAA